MTTPQEVRTLALRLSDSAQLSTLPEWCRKEIESAANMLDELARLKEVRDEDFAKAVAAWEKADEGPTDFYDCLRAAIVAYLGGK